MLVLIMEVPFLQLPLRMHIVLQRRRCSCLQQAYPLLAECFPDCHTYLCAREAEERALRELEDSKGEWFRLKQLEDEYVRNYEEANNRYNSLRGRGDPASKYAPASDLPWLHQEHAPSSLCRA